jgi:prepilin-type N-terminal cleavage/methylation domain-containing protein
MRSDGFSLVEMIVAMALMVTITAVMFALVDPSQATYTTQLEAADMEQRLRVAAGTLYRDLLMAGAGAYQGGNTGALTHYFAPVLPYRQGTNHDDTQTFKTDTITLMYVPPTVAQTTLATDGPAAPSADIGVESGGGCPLADAACGFKNGMTVLLYGGAGEYDTFAVTNVVSNTLHIEHSGGALTYSAYRPHSTAAVELTNVVYYLKNDPATESYQLMSREGRTGSDVPVVDHVVALRFDYYGDPQPPLLIKPLSDPVGPWTTYGPPPPALDEQIPTSGYPAGENCTFVVDPISGLHVPRLSVLDSSGDANALVPLTSAQLTDGPWCPDGMSANRWDADLLRVRRIGVMVKVESANAALRGPAGVLFAHGGIATRSDKWLPDRQVTFQVTPRNLGR